MGQRVNLADLARDDVPDTYDDTSTSRARHATASHDGRGGSRSNERAGSEVANTAAEWRSVHLPVSDVAPNPLNERPDDDDQDDDFAQLVATIRHYGVLQPIVVCSVEAFATRYPNEQTKTRGASWVALIGNRRLRGAAAAGVEHIPALINDEHAASMYEVMLIENGHRKSLSPLHEAEAMQRLILEAKVNQRGLAARIGRTPMYVSHRIALLGLVPGLREALEAGTLKLELARQMGGLSIEEQEAILAAGPPYRRSSAIATPDRPTSAVPRRRTIAVSSPARAAASIREVFTETERAELIRLLESPADESEADTGS